MLSPIDIAILVLVGITAAVGFWTGFVWQVIRIISVIASIWAALVYRPVASSFLAGRVPASYRDLACTLGVFVVAMVLCYLVSYLFREVVNALKPQLTDRILGAVFGLLLGALLGAFFAFSVLEFAEEDSRILVAVENSNGARLMGRFLGHALPDGLREAVEEPEEPGVPPPAAQPAGGADLPSEPESAPAGEDPSPEAEPAAEGP